MKNHDKTKEQLLHDLENIRKELAELKRRQGRRDASLKELSEMPKVLDRFTPFKGYWHWYPEENVVIINRRIRKESPETSVYREESIFEGEWNEIVHPDDLNSLMKDLDDIFKGQARTPAFYFRTTSSGEWPKSMMGSLQYRHAESAWGSCIDPTEFMELIKDLRQDSALSKRFVTERLSRSIDFSEKRYKELLISALMWDIMIKDIFKEHPEVVEVIKDVVIPYYEKLEFFVHRLGKYVSFHSRTTEFLSRAILQSHNALFFKEEGKYKFVSPAFASSVGLSQSEIFGMSDEQLFGEGGKSDFEEYFYEPSLQTQSKLVTVRTGRTTTELMIVQLPGEDPAHPYGSSWGLACDPRDIEQKAESEGRLIEYQSKAMRAALEKADQAARKDSIVLITGESGSGKDYLAKYIHRRSARADGPYFSINCAALAPELAESELFGHEKGAFTGAMGKKRGLLELAEGGTLLLNEIGELSLLLQAKLLTFLDSRKFTRVGGEKEVSVSARLIAATNKDLEEAVKLREFRKDLYYRINVIQIQVPPLRERPEDLPLLVRELLKILAAEMELPYQPWVAPKVLQDMMRHPWEGNVREVRNVLERAIIQTDGPQIKIDFPQPSTGQGRDSLQIGQAGEAHYEPTWCVVFPPEKKLEDLAKDMKRALIHEALRRAAGKKAEAARLLGITRDSLNKQIKTLGISSVPETH